jgi:hypothetical protein
MINRTLPPGTVYSAAPAAMTLDVSYRPVDEIAGAGIAACDELIAALIEVRGDLVTGTTMAAVGMAGTLERPRQELEAALRLLARRHLVTR